MPLSLAGLDDREACTSGADRSGTYLDEGVAQFAPNEWSWQGTAIEIKAIDWAEYHSHCRRRTDSGE
jgi:hypothetical protein